MNDQFIILQANSARELALDNIPFTDEEQHYKAEIVNLCNKVVWDSATQGKFETCITRDDLAELLGEDFEQTVSDELLLKCLDFLKAYLIHNGYKVDDYLDRLDEADDPTREVFGGISVRW